MIVKTGYEYFEVRESGALSIVRLLPAVTVAATSTDDVQSELMDFVARRQCFKLVLDLSAPAGTATGAAATDELARLMEAIGKEPGFAASVREEVEAVLSELPAHRRNALMPDEAAVDALGERLLANGASRLVARMKGAAG